MSKKYFLTNDTRQSTISTFTIEKGNFLNLNINTKQKNASLALKRLQTISYISFY